MSISEYLYVDEIRLQSYIEQIGSPITYDIVPTWKGEISVTGPKATTTKEKMPRPLTRPEKVQKLLEHIKNNSLAHNVRPNWGELMNFRYHSSEKGAKKLFVLEECNARKIIIPPNPENKKIDPNFIGLVLWFSEPIILSKNNDELNSGILILLEDDSLRDNNFPISRIRRGGTAYTVLQSLSNAVRREESSRKTAWSKNIYKEFRRMHDHKINDMLLDPIKVFKNLDCIVSSNRKIRVLYRIREYGLENEYGLEDGSNCISTFGYPIFILDNQ